MGHVYVSLTISLDGFIAGPNDGHQFPLGEGGERLFQWYSTGDTEYTMPDGKMTSMISRASADYLAGKLSQVGALICGRRTFDIAHGWGGRHPVDVPVVVVTHAVPAEWVDTHAPFTFVTDGIESAVRQAQAIAGDRDIGVAAASITQQCLRAGLLDGIQLNLVPVLLGGGVRLFDQIGTRPIELERVAVIDTPDVTHLEFRVIREPASASA